MIEYQFSLLSIDYRPQENLFLQTWTGKELSAETFMYEMRCFLNLVEKTRSTKNLRDHTNFYFQIPDTLYPWIENLQEILN
jgi:hypothetical protein